MSFRPPLDQAEIVKRRQQRLTPRDRNLWEYDNRYFQARHPILYADSGADYLTQVQEVPVEFLAKDCLWPY